jgi:osmotically-inducible protein OsmY
VAGEEFRDVTPANDAMLVQVVRGALGRHPRLRGGPRINVSSCSFVVTLHGLASSAERRLEIEAAVRAVPGVEGVVNRLEVT